MNRIRILKLLFIITIITSCSNDDNSPKNLIDQLPPETQTGANTFGFLANGKPTNITNTSNQTAIYQGGFIQFGGGSIYMIVSDSFTVGNQNNLRGKARYFVDPNPQLGCHYEFGDAYEGYVTFTKIDKVNYIISGTFEFSTITDDCEDIQITNGRFDLEYIP